MAGEQLTKDSARRMYGLQEGPTLAPRPLNGAHGDTHPNPPIPHFAKLPPGITIAGTESKFKK